MNIRAVTYHALLSGPTFVVLGGVHGNEKCGTQAIEMVIRQFDQSILKLSCGRLIFIPVANPEAYVNNVRFIDRNLNRYLFPKEQPQHYEDYLDPIICSYLDHADVLLDLHSYASPGGPFIFLGNSNPEELAFARALGVRDFVWGWQEAYGNSNKKDGGLESIGTTEYTRSKQGIAVTLECGQHFNTNAADVGFQAIVRALCHLDMLADNTLYRDVPICAQTEQRCIKMKQVFYKEKPGNFIKTWEHFTPVASGEVLAQYEDGQTLLAPEDAFIVLPKKNSDVGSEWFYLGTISEFPGEC